MSRTTKNIKKPFCKVCQDAGKPEREYTSHWVKDMAGNTTCPTLLNTECRFCHKLGHTAKFCKELNKKPATPDVKKAPVKVTQNNQVAVSAFAALDEDSEEEEQPEPEPEKVVKNDWASIAAKPKNVEPVMQSTGFVTLTKNTKYKPVQAPETVAPKLVPKPAPAPMKRWADLSDDEEEEEEEEEDYTW
jgi:hypothetical protein